MRLSVILLLLAGCTRSDVPPSAVLLISGEGDAQAKGAAMAVRCLGSGGKAPLRYRWQWPGLRLIGRSPPDASTLVVEAVARSGPTPEVICTVTDASQSHAEAHVVFAPLSLLRVSLEEDGAGSAGARLALTGSGFSARHRDDGVWLDPDRASPIALDLGCKSASWSDRKIVGCVPASLPKGRYRVRLQSGGRLVTLPWDRA